MFLQDREMQGAASERRHGILSAMCLVSLLLQRKIPQTSPIRPSHGAWLEYKYTSSDQTYLATQIDVQRHPEEAGKNNPYFSQDFKSTCRLY